MTDQMVGIIGLGNMGSPIAAHIVAGGFEVVCYDKAGTAERCPVGAHAADSVAAVAQRAAVIFFSLPDGAVVDTVAGEILAVDDRRVRSILDTSTIGVSAAQAMANRFRAGNVTYLDAPISGGVSGARSRKLAVMFSGPRERYEQYLPLLKTFANRQFYVGDTPGQGQALKTLNNFLSATALTATGEAIAFGVEQGLDMQLMCEVLSVSTGSNTATSDKFPNRVATGSYDAGFSNTLMAKDLALYLEAAQAGSHSTVVGELIATIWQEFVTAEPDVDFTRIYPFLSEN